MEKRLGEAARVVENGRGGGGEGREPSGVVSTGSVGVENHCGLAKKEEEVYYGLLSEMSIRKCA